MAYAQLLASGLQVGKSITLLESTPEKMVLMDGETWFLGIALVID